MLNDRPQSQGRDEVQGSYQNDYGDQPDDKERRMCWERAGALWSLFLFHQRASQSQSWNGKEKTPNHHGYPAGKVIERVIGADTSECAAVVVPLGREEIEHLTETVRTGVEDCSLARVRHHSNCCENQYGDRHDQYQQ